MFSLLKNANGQKLADAYPVVPTLNGQYNTNNLYSKFPPLTADGRNVIASWQPGAELNEDILRKNGIQSNWQYRKFMTENANNLRTKMFQDALNDVGYSVRNVEHAKSEEYVGPKRYGSLFDPVHNNGQLSDLKENYLSREQLQAKMVVPSLTQDQLIQLHK